MSITKSLSLEEMISFDFYFENSTDFICVIDKNGKFIKVNPIFSTKLGYSSDQIIGEPFINFVHPEDVSISILNFEKVFGGMTDLTMINRYRKSDGSYIFVEWQAHVFPDVMVAQGVDVTEKMNLEQELKESIERLRRVFDNSPNMVALLDAETHKYLEFNKQMEIATGRTRKDLLGQEYCIYPLWHDKDQRDIFFRKVKEDKQVTNFTAELQPFGKEIRKYLVSGGLIDYKDQKQMVVIAPDFTAYYKKENGLRESEKRIADLFDNMVEFFTLYKITDDKKDLIFIQANKAYLQNYDFAVKELSIGKKWSEVNEKADMAQMAAFISLVEKEHPKKFTMKHAGSDRWIKGSAYIPSPGYLALLFSDITEEKRTQDLVLQQKEELEAAAKEKDALISVLVHDLRSPFGALLNFSEIFRDEIDELSKEEIKEMATSVSSLISSAYSNMNEMIEYVLHQRGLSKIEKSKMDVCAVAKRATAFLKGSYEGKKIELNVANGKYLDINADPKKVESIFSNLISNAIKFTPRGGKIDVTFEDKGDFVQCTVSDTGIGVPEESKDSLFSVESKLKRKGTEGEASSGMGLLLCKEFVTLHNGEIRCENNPGGGTSFIFTLEKNGVHN